MTILICFALIMSIGAPTPDIGDSFFEKVPVATLLVSVLAYWIITAGMAWLNSQRGIRGLARDEAVDEVVHKHRLGLLGLQLWLITGFGVLLVGGLSRQLYEIPSLARIPLGCETVEMLVFFVACVLFWRCGFRFDRHLRWQVEQQLMLAGQPVRPGWTAGQHLAFNIRHHFLFVAVPLGLIMLLRDVVGMASAAVIPPSAQSWAGTAILLGSVAVVYFVSPLMLVRVWRTRRLPPGQLRQRLEELCRRIPLRYRDILIWDTGGVVVNAGVMGLHRSVRYVLISDAMLEQMDDRQIVAVFGHEAGHVVHHHMGYFLVFAAGAMMLTTALVTMLADVLRLSNGMAQLAMLTAILLTWGFGFGWLSRRFERQADVFGAWCAGEDAAAHGYAPTAGDGDLLAAGTPSFVVALENVGRLNGLPRATRNWRHGSIASRVAFLGRWAGSGLTRQQFDRGVMFLKLVMWAFLLMGVIGAAVTWQQWMQ